MTEQSQPVSQQESILQPITQQQIQASVENYQNSVSDVWYLKTVEFGEGDTKRTTKIITQNFNGPCSFIAICNILILRGAIEILPPGRKTVSYEFLSQLLAEHLLMTCPDVDISAALEIMPCTQKGMDLNPLFTGAKSFRPNGIGGELKLFEQVGIDLVHGWLVDPESPEAEAISQTEDYDSAVMLIAEADHITKGRFVVDDSDIDIPQAGSSRSPVYSDEERAKIENATSIRRFLDNTQSQLTYHGLFHLASTTKPGSLMALFRNLHLSVLYKRDTPDDSSLYSLVTDYVFSNEPSIVWERIEDVQGSMSTFVDSSFVKSSPAGGDFAGETAEDALRAAEREQGEFYPSDPADLALAQQLQAEEQEHARQEREWYAREKERRRLEEIQRQQEKEDQKRRGKKEKKDCIIM
ncbi:hypothetical protein DFH05DRAFT_1453255 [Lentinula detonsa]|uniref:MINDY deubiquitinase domain-containing protein n=1 Tax=Lentinula detonsa TaxID=2804962 RepID=A0A9W8NRY3_9AGAR|nr:hypothetical protein DFH05DRAFT_1453255 [Lentinula detonsa]KAJ3797079.1 hypothetical protein GGU11DRAFT_786086 [Lentinula aff. detonsa]KAJ3986783.1 hypothetical protein F5890DRAFT_930482 [Lentinula detonsa]